MTTDHDLRDLLTTEAAGATGPATDWDDIVRRGRHHRRVTRTRRGLVAGALAAAIAIGGFALLDSTDDDRDDVIVDEPNATVKAPPGFGPWITSARARGATLTIVTTGSDPATGWDPCIGYRPRIMETATRVVVELVDPRDPDAVSWESCQASEDDPTAGQAFNGAAWGSIELDRPLGGRPLVDGYTGQDVLVDDGTALLFPTYLPKPLRLDRWSQEGTGCGMACSLGGWTLSFTDGDAGLELTAERPEEDFVANRLCRSADDQPHPGTGFKPLATPVAVRGTTGALCSPSEGTYYLTFVEDDVTYGLSLGHSGLAVPGAPFTREDIIAIAEGLEPFEG